MKVIDKRTERNNDDLQHLVRSEYRHVEKVNAKLVIE